MAPPAPDIHRRSRSDKHSFDPRAWGRAGEAAIAERVRQACEQFGSAARSLVALDAASDRAATPLIGLD